MPPFYLFKRKKPTAPPVAAHHLESRAANQARVSATSLRRNRNPMFRFELLFTDAKFVPAVSHQVAQFLDAELTDFMHADQDRGSNGQAPMTDLADDGRRHFQCARQCSIVFKFEFAD